METNPAINQPITAFITPTSQEQQPTAIPQPDLNVPKSPARRKYPILLIVLSAIILLLLLGAGLYLWRKNPATRGISQTQLRLVAESINPFIPNGYSLAHKAKLIKFPGGGVLYDTQLVNGDKKIGIVIKPAGQFTCTISPETLGNKQVCIYESASSKSVSWIAGQVAYEVLTGSQDISLDDLRQIATSL